MKTFKEYIEDNDFKNNNEIIEEGFFTSPFGFKFGVKIWITYLIFKYGKKIFSKKANYKNKATDNIVYKSEEKKWEDINNKKENGELKYVFKRIEEKQWDKAREEFNLIHKKDLQTKQCIIEKIISVCGSPPVYNRSPGNETYRAIKKILGQQTATQITKVFLEIMNSNFKEQINKINLEKDDDVRTK